MILNLWMQNLTMKIYQAASRAITELELANIIPELTLDADLLALDVGADPTVLAQIHVIKKTE